MYSGGEGGVSKVNWWVSDFPENRCGEVKEVGEGQGWLGSAHPQWWNPHFMFKKSCSGIVIITITLGVKVCGSWPTVITHSVFKKSCSKYWNQFFELELVWNFLHIYKKRNWKIKQRWEANQFCFLENFPACDYVYRWQIAKWIGWERERVWKSQTAWKQASFAWTIWTN